MIQRRKHQDFQFKKFSVSHQCSSIAVGTDAVLLASFTDTYTKKNILDVGTGCGVIALALAQKTEIDTQLLAIDIDIQSVEEANHNFQKSDWHKRLFAKKCSFDDIQEQDFDLIVSNPPFFRDSLLNPDAHRTNARHQTNFDMESFSLFCKKNSSDSATISLIYPASDLDYLTKIFENSGFHLQKTCTVFSKKSKNASRVLVSFEKQVIDKQELTLVIYEENNDYTTEYKQFTKEYYLHF